MGFGGQFTTSPKVQTTHVIAVDNNHPYCKLVRASKPDVKIVLPHWVDDSCRLRRRLDETPYLLPNPSILSGDALEKLTPEKINETIIGDRAATTSKRQGTPPSEPVPSHEILASPSDSESITTSDSPFRPRLSEKDRHLFEGKKFYLASDLELKKRAKKALVTIIEEAGGSIMEDMDNDFLPISKSNVYIGRWRKNEEYVKASRKGWVIGTFRWIIYMISLQEWQSPTVNLLHYPLVYGGMKELEGAQVSLTGFTGEARRYVIDLIEAIGAIYCQSLLSGCKYLIAAQPRSRKYKAAQKWNIHVVNQLWLEETYAKWEIQSVTNPRYTYFPVIGDLTTATQSTELDLQVLKKFYCTSEEIAKEKSSELFTTTPSDPPQKETKRKRKSIKGKAVPTDDTTARPSLGSSEPTTSLEKPGKPANPDVITDPKTPSSHKAAELPPPTSVEAAKTPSPHKTAHLLNADARSPTKTPTQSSPKPTEEPGTPSGRIRVSARKAQLDASAKLKMNVEDMNQFEKFKKGKTRNIPLPGVEEMGSSKKSDNSKNKENEPANISVSDDEELQDREQSPSKKQARGNKSTTSSGTKKRTYSSSSKEPEEDTVKVPKRQKPSNDTQAHSDVSQKEGDDSAGTSQVSKTSKTGSTRVREASRKRSNTPSGTISPAVNLDSGLAASVSRVTIVGAPLHILLTSMEMPDPSQTQILSALGIHLEQVPTKCKYVISTKLARTEKLTKALAHGVRLLGPMFFKDILDSIEDGDDSKKHVFDPSDPKYIMPDDPHSKMQGFTSQSVYEASFTRYGGPKISPLFKGFVFNYTPESKGFPVYDTIAREHGSKMGINMKSLRSSKPSLIYESDVVGLRQFTERVRAESKTAFQEDDEIAESGLYKLKVLVAKDNKSDSKTVKSFVSTTLSEGFIPLVVSTSWLLKSVFRSEVDFGDTDDVYWPESKKS